MNKVKAQVEKAKVAMTNKDNKNADTNPNSTNAGPHDSNVANKADPRVDSDRDGSRNMGARDNTGFNNTSTTGGNNYSHSTNAGPHDSNVANKADPRVDSDRDGSRNLGAHSSTTGHSTTGHGTTGYGNTSTNAGPHDSNLANKADPRVDSDRDGSRNMGAHSGTTSHGTTGYGNTSTNAGPHDSNLANKADPRVDSDRDGSRNLGAHSSTTGHSTTGHGTTGYGNTSTNAGPHDSNLANKADPRVDSDRDGSRNMGARSGNTGYSSHNPSMTTAGQGTHGHHGHHDPAHPATGPADSTAGPHKSDMMNKMDPRVDSDLDGHKNQKFHESGDINSGDNFQDRSSANQQENFQSTNHGPHKGNLANKADPRVDSDLDSSRGGAVQAPTGGNFNAEQRY